ncbi:hypothetical protein C8J56DRAFT_895050 [Mycena floridula]|nr:hypothetical protein C8J56DRAFT_895050 [Mycena floridula]
MTPIDFFLPPRRDAPKVLSKHAPVRSTQRPKIFIQAPIETVISARQKKSPGLFFRHQHLMKMKTTKTKEIKAAQLKEMNPAPKGKGRPTRRLRPALQLTRKKKRIKKKSKEDSDGDDSSDDETNGLKPYRWKEEDGIWKPNRAMKTIPSFEATMHGYAEDYDAILKIIETMTKCASQGRADDTNKIWGKLLQIIDPVAPAENSLTMPMPTNKIHEHADKIMNELQGGELVVTADEWPNFLYDNEVADYWSAEELGYEDKEVNRLETGKSDSDISMLRPLDYELGLLSGFMMKHCIFGNTFHDKGPRKNKKNVAELNSITAVTPELIAYAACQGRFGMDSMSEWGMEDGLFEMDQFYENIVALCDDMDDPWVQETLEWWNDQIFPKRPPTKLTASFDDDTPEPAPSSKNSVMAAREARRQERAKVQLAGMV